MKGHLWFEFSEKQSVFTFLPFSSYVVSFSHLTQRTVICELVHRGVDSSDASSLNTKQFQQEMD